MEKVICPICQEDIQGETYELKCHHSSHTKCTAELLKESDKINKLIRYKSDTKLYIEYIGYIKCPICRNSQSVNIKEKIEKTSDLETSIIAKIIIDKDCISGKTEEIWIELPSQLVQIGNKIGDIKGSLDLIDQIFKTGEIIILHLTPSKFILEGVYKYDKHHHMTLDTLYRLLFVKTVIRECPIDRHRVNTSSSDSDYSIDS